MAPNAGSLKEQFTILNTTCQQQLPLILFLQNLI